MHPIKLPTTYPDLYFMCQTDLLKFFNIKHTITALGHIAIKTCELFNGANIKLYFLCFFSRLFVLIEMVTVLFLP